MTNTIITGPVPFFNSIKAISSLAASPDVPTGKFVYKNLSDEQKEQLRGHGLREEEGKPGSFIGSPASGSLGALLTLGPIEVRHDPGVVRTEGYLAYTVCIKIAQIFSYVSVCAKNARLNLLLDDNLSYASTGEDFEILQEGLSEKPSIQKLTAKVPANHNFISTQRAKTIIYPFDTSKALPSGFVSSQAEFQTDGIFFPYFGGMLLPDWELITSELLPFIPILGADAVKAHNLWNMVRPGVRDLATTSAGRLIGHMFLGIRLARQSKSMIHFIADGTVYRGFVLLNPDLEVSLYGKTMSARSAENLSEDVAESGQHAKALAKVIGLINSAVKPDGSSYYDFPMARIAQSSGLRQVLNIIELSNYNLIPDFNSTLIKAMSQLQYGEAFPGITYKTVKAFTEFLVSGDMSVLDPFPFYISDHALDFARVTVGLSIFGTRVPSLNYGSTKDLKFQMPSSEDAEDPNLVETEGKRVVQFLPFTDVAYGVGINQWNSLLAAGAFYIPAGKKGTREFTDKKKYCLSIGGKQFAGVYNDIKRRSIHVREGLRGGKRRRDGEEGDEKAGVKKARIVASVAADL